MNKLIADCGSTKIDWALCNAEGRTEMFNSPGVNPVLLNEEEIDKSFAQALAFQTTGKEQIKEVYFYGAGCVGEHALTVEKALRNNLPSASIFVYSDLLGAARALLKNEEGIACILGTGSNSCLFDGQQIQKNIPPLGFILGDEGSGAALGKMLLNAIYKQRTGDTLRSAFEEETRLTLPDVLRHVYRSEMPSRFLASLVPFASRHIADDTIRQAVNDNFRRFFSCNIAPYGRRDLPVSFVGGMAATFGKQLREVAESEGYTVRTILAKPIDGLISFHCTGM